MSCRHDGVHPICRQHFVKIPNFYRYKIAEFPFLFADTVVSLFPYSLRSFPFCLQPGLPFCLQLLHLSFLHTKGVSLFPYSQ